MLFLEGDLPKEGRRMVRRRAMAIVTVLALACAACGDNDNSNGNDNTGPRPTVTPTTAPGPTATPPPQIPCPQLITYIVQTSGSDLDVGWTGIYHDQVLGTGGALSFALDCAGSFLGQCGDCALTGPIASTTVVDNHRCRNATATHCTSDTDCSGSTCEFFFGAPLPITGGGVPICVTNQVDGPVTGDVHPELGDGTSNIAIIFTSFVGISDTQPCPVCSGATVGATGTCQGGARNGQPCTTDGTTPFFGNTSFDCPPVPGADIGSSNLPLNLTTGTREIPLSSTCTGVGAVGDPCYCENQERPNACTDGVCTVDANGEGTCAAGPNDSVCAIESFRSCANDDGCPAAGDSCTTKLRGCLGATDANGTLTGPLARTGAPSQATPLQVATFCVGATRNVAVNAAAGLTGPGALRLPTAACIKPSCP
jgi:hypothetical protein